jgi:hypothetical protein
MESHAGRVVRGSARIRSGEVASLEFEVRQAPGVAEALQPYAVHAVEAELKGVDQTTPVYIVGARPAQEMARVA